MDRMNTRYLPGSPVGVLTTQPLDRPLDYRAPESGVEEGALVEVPLGPRRVVGVVWGEAAGDWPVERLRGIGRVLDAPPLAAPFRDFLERAGAYTLTPLPAMLRLALRAPGLGERPGERRVYALGSGAPDRMTAARENVLAVLRERPHDVFALAELAGLAGVSSGVVKGLVGSGAVAERISTLLRR